MPFGSERVAATYAREILRVVNGSEVAENGVIEGMSVPLNADNRRILESGQVLVWAGVNEQQKITLGGALTAWTATYSAQTTGSLSPTITAAALQTALAALSSVGAGNIDVQGSDGGPFTVTFVGSLSAQNLSPITTTPTGGTAVVTTIQDGAVASNSTGQQKLKPAAASGIASTDVAGILMHTTEFYTDSPHANQADAAVAIFTKNCNFAAAQLSGYSGNSAAVKAAMTGAGNGKCANCTIE